MSAPETNALPPAPESTSARTFSSCANASSARSTACHIASETALRFSGLLNTRWPTPSSLRLMICSLMFCPLLLARTLAPERPVSARAV